jgi:chloride channel 3/4/5
MSSSVPGQGKVQSDLNTSSTGKKADAEPLADSADSDDDLLLYGDHRSDTDPIRDVGSSLVEQSVFSYYERALRLLEYRSPFPSGPLPQTRSKSNLFSSTTPSSSRQASPAPKYLNLRARNLRDQVSHNASNTSLGSRSSPLNGIGRETKAGGSLDWYVEGPGRRVGYDDLTAIDWIFEYTKERQRLRILSSTTSGLVGYVRQLLDASHVWVVLILTGVAVAILAASINIASDWLSDIKFGFCKSDEKGGQFYLNKGFCCWGHDGTPSASRHKYGGDATDVVQNSLSVKLGHHGDKLFIFHPQVVDTLSSTSSTYYSRLQRTSPLHEARLMNPSQVLFAGCAAVLVKHYAIYAKHSGIPEIKTVLGGVVMRRFMGPWTLTIKSLGLV